MANRKKKRYSYKAGSKKIQSFTTAVIVVILAVAALFIAPDFFEDIGFGDSQRTDKVVLDGTMQVHFIDVGQGDSALIVTPGGYNILIDAGTNESETALRAYLDSQDVTDIEYAVFTHPHEDHIGGADMVLLNYNVKNTVLPDVTHTTKTFERMLEAIDSRDVNMITSEVGKVYEIDDVSFKILAPVSDKYSDLNDYSVVVRVDYGGTSFMFTGDAEKLSESEMLRQFPESEFACDVLKVGHHGSTTSTSSEFLSAVNPIAAVISCGTNNTYGHPHQETIDLLNDAGVNIYRTDLFGSVVFKADGMNVMYISD